MQHRLTYLLIMLVLMAPSISIANECRAPGELFSLTLERSEQLQIVAEELQVAKNDRSKAMSALMPNIDLFANYKQYDEGNPMMAQPEWTSTWGATVQQGFTVNGRELKALRVIDHMIEKADYDLQASRDDMLLAVFGSYIALLAAEEQITIADANLERLQRYLDDVNARLKLREVPRTAMLRAEAELSGAKTEKRQAEIERDLAAARLASLVGLKSVDCVETIALPVPMIEPSLEDLIIEAMKNRHDLKALAEQRQVAAGQVEVQKGDLWPRVDLEAGYLSADNDMSSDSLDQLYAGVNIRFRIFDGGLRKGFIGEANSRKRQADHLHGDKVRQVRVEVESALKGLELNRYRVSTLNEQLSFASDNYRAVNEQFKYGLATSVDVIDANSLLVTSERQLQSALLQLQFSQLQLERATGTLKQRTDTMINNGGSEQGVDSNE